MYKYINKAHIIAALFYYMGCIMIFLNILFALFVIFAFILLFDYSKIKKGNKVFLDEANLNNEDLILHAERISKLHESAKSNFSSRKLINRLNDNHKYIYNTNKQMSKLVYNKSRTVPAVEWLLDNYYLIEELIITLQLTLKKGSFKKLPVIKYGNMSGYPRIYAIMAELISHTDSFVLYDSLIKFIKAYQKERPLNNLEIWSIGVTTQIALVESIREQCEKINIVQNQYEKAEAVLKQIKAQKSDQESILTRLTKEYETENISLFEHMYKLVKKQNSPNLIGLLDKHLAEMDLSWEKITRTEVYKQTQSQAIMGNAISSIRIISALDFTTIFEELSVVENILNSDPSKIYPMMDFESRNFYRRKVEQIAKEMNVSETQVAKKAVELSALGSSLKERHVGNYLVTNPFNKKGIHGKTREYAYFVAIYLPALLLSLFMTGYSYGISGSSVVGISMFILSIIPSIDIISNIVNYIFSKFTRPSIIPKLDFEGGIPDDAASLVIITALLSGKNKVQTFIDSLEKFYLSNKHENIYFGVLGDYPDAKVEILPQDNDILEELNKGIDKLNSKYGTGRFHAFVRKRSYNKSHARWMGWERKRGAIVQLIRLLRGVNENTFTGDSSSLSDIKKIKYLITLDADTILPISAAKELIGAMHHPINRAELSEDKAAVISGYGLMQPRIATSIENANKSVFSKIFAGQGGIDPYSSAVSDVYQDVFGEGIFTGKGIIDIDAFNSTLQNAIPDNTVLSHDLLEGSYLRTALISDIQLIDGYPHRYLSYMARLYRWVRGDWQLLPWLFKRVKNKDGQKVQNPLNTISKYKIFDNLRRSLVYTFLILYIIFTSVILPLDMLLVVLFPLITILCSLLIAAFDYVIEGGYKNAGQKYHSTIIYGLKSVLLQTFLLFAFLPHMAYMMTDATIRSLYRSFISKKYMLEWVTASDSEKKIEFDLKSHIFKMLPCVIFGIAIFLFTYSIIWLVLSIVWMISPLLAFYVSRPLTNQIVEISKSNSDYLRILARKIWRFFEDIVSEKDNYLPPDNYQEYPPNGIAHRTSPTNIGLYMMSVLAARDFGYIDTFELAAQFENTLDTVEKLDKWKGHLYNWYNTKTLATLRPRYVSTVDSGNFVSYLIVIKEGICELINNEPIDKSNFYGLLDTVRIEKPELEQQIIKLLKNNDILASWKMLIEYFSTLDLSECLLIKKTVKKFSQNILSLFDENENNILKMRLKSICERIEMLINETRFEPLYCTERNLFSIGFNIEEDRLTKSYYDLMASEARQTSFVAIARGEIPKKHWQKLSRSQTRSHKYKGLVSWTGTMFEYLMPLLIMKNYENTLFDETYKFVLSTQIKYAKSHKIPWGISESGFYSFDINLNYQYKAFGVPDLGLKRGLMYDLVLTPYAAILGIVVDGNKTIENLKMLSKMGVEDVFGFYEAVDFTPSRLTNGENFNLVKSYMAHHQGMSLISIDNYLNKNIMQERFHSNPIMKSAEELLQEKVPIGALVVRNENIKAKPQPIIKSESEELIRIIENLSERIPEVHILSNGQYSVFLTTLGLGYSKCSGRNITRWRENTSYNIYGTFAFIENISENCWWSNTLAPNFSKPEKYKVTLSSDKAEFFRKDGDVETLSEITVCSEDNGEIRKIHLKNCGARELIIDITGYLELVLSQQNADIAHVAFNNLFIRTEYDEKLGAIIAGRRSRIDGSDECFVIYKAVVLEGEKIGVMQFETDRNKFIGRGNTIINPDAIGIDKPLTGSVGAVLDPVAALRIRLKLKQAESAAVAFVTIFAETKSDALEVAQKYNDSSSVACSFELAWTRSKVEQKYLSLSSEEQNTFYQLLKHIMSISPQRKLFDSYIKDIRIGQMGLWSYGISGDLPIVSVLIHSQEETELVELMLKCHEFLRMKQISFELFFFNTDEDCYSQTLSGMIKEMISISHAREIFEKSGGVFVRSKSSIPENDFNLFMAVSRVVLDGKKGSVVNQLCEIREEFRERPEIMETTREYKEYPLKVPELYNFNGFGGFSDNEYVIILKPNQSTPAPWINVIANHRFGFLISESGGGYIWSENSRENKLTAWSNDYVSDEPSEIIYIKDNATNEVWTPTPRPLGQHTDFKITHGFGYTIFENNTFEIDCRLTMFVPRQEPIKINLLELKNLSDYERTFTIYYYINPVLGVSREFSAQFLYVEKLCEQQTLLIKNNYNTEFDGRIAFLDTTESIVSYTSDKNEFLGGSKLNEIPYGILKEKLTGNLTYCTSVGCAYSITVSLKPGECRKIGFLTGQTKDEEQIRTITNLFKNISYIEEALSNAKGYWHDILGVIKVKTPSKEFDLLLNGWLLYQTISCRLWARSAFYQSGGAYGFRDQLQDVLAILLIEPQMALSQILRHASHQYIEGDVQHWWHPKIEKDGPSHRGVRTRFSDDLLWLPYVVAQYIEKTGDKNILDIEVQFLEDEVLGGDEVERYNCPHCSHETKSIYEHCVRAIEKATKFGANGLPLIGSGDWNDSFSNIGLGGKGESVWLGWFMYTTINSFIPICIMKNDNDRADRYRIQIQELIINIEKSAWDGNWYKRAFFDDGTPLGCAENDECKIDSISQSWAVISGAAKSDRIKDAMLSLEKHLIDYEQGIVKLLTPPFESSKLAPGYIKGYVAGVRENGGQYTHAAVWVILAYLLMNEGDKAFNIFSLICPINHSSTQLGVNRYKTEPFVLAADVYSTYPNAGRGGWTWYTGAAGWMYRVATEYMVGIKKYGDKLKIDPCIPSGWEKFEIQYKYLETLYVIEVNNTLKVQKGVYELFLDGINIKEREISLQNDKINHKIIINMG